jgi:hypothetical protein
MSTLSERLQAKSAMLGERAIREMFEDPFWQARFGARGREMAEKDSQFHLSYLIQALLAEDARVFENYARWLQTLLISRGMCSRHIAENFLRLERAIEDEVDQPEVALEVLRAGRQALVYPPGPASELQLCAEALAERTLETLVSRQPSWFSMAATRTSMAAFESVAQAEQARFKRDVLDVIAYLADAIHASRSDLFADHVAWMQELSSGRQGPATRVQETLLALDECLGPLAPGASPMAAAAPEARGTKRPSNIPPARGSNAPAPRASLRPVSKRPSLSPPPDSPVPVAVSAELGTASRQLIELALQRLSEGAPAKAPTLAPPAPAASAAPVPGAVAPPAGGGKRA